MTPQQQIEEFGKKFDKPLSDEAHRLITSTRNTHVYYDNADIKFWIIHQNITRLEEEIAWLEGKIKDVEVLPSAPVKPWTDGANRMVRHILTTKQAELEEWKALKQDL